MKKSICVRLLLILLFLFCGTKLPFFFLVAAVIAYSIFFDLRGEPKKLADLPQRNNNWTFIDAETPEWKRIYLDRVCESPAEVAFLTAMISSYQLTPDKGTLKARGLELQLQIPIDHYRVDFLANKYLVIEIDGAAYHSSPEAVETDRIRDNFLTHNGYVVLRIPAKVVFNSPNEAVERVRRALSNLARERNIRAQEEARAKALNPPATFFGEIGNSIRRGNEWMDRVLAMQNAGKPAVDIFQREVSLIDSALKLAEMRVQREDWLSKASERERESLELLEKAVKDVKVQPTKLSVVLGQIPPILPPAAHPNAEINTLITDAHFRLKEDRLKYFRDIRGKLSKDNRLCRHVQTYLETNNYGSYWLLISPDGKDLQLLEAILSCERVLVNSRFWRSHAGERHKGSLAERNSHKDYEL